MVRRADGELEQLVLGVLWNSPEPLSPSRVRELLGLDLAYTSVATVLTRLLAKGLVSRRPAGRSFAYLPTVTSDEWNSARLVEVLGHSRNRGAALAHFVGRLSRKDVEDLRKILEELGP